jgi:hypothetical protein
MTPKEKQLLESVMLECNNLRTCADLLAQALIHGGMDRQWEALQVFEAMRGKAVSFPQQNADVFKHRDITYRRVGKRKGESWGFNCEPFQPKHPNEDQ